MKSLLNSPSSCVDDLVDALLLTNPNLVRVEGFNAVVLQNITELKEQQVTLLSGGGSGHEPAHAGFVGDGMLSGAILGHVFASPSVSSIAATIRVAAGSKGVLLIVKNYTGDRLNFGMALEQAKQEGFVIGKMIIVDDDSALPPGKGITGGRGIAGTVLVHKIAGAMAKSGSTLDEIHSFLTNSIVPRLRTLGIALSVCHLPTQTISHAISSRLSEPRSIEVGMGIHGEPGREQSFLPETNAARFAAECMLDAVLTRLNILPSAEAKGVVVLVNNLGALPVIELMTVAKEVTQILYQKYNLIATNLFVGTYMTSLDMNGVSVSILDPSANYETILAMIGAPTTAPAWHSNVSPVAGLTPELINLSTRVICSGSGEGGSDDSHSNSSKCKILIDPDITTTITRAICTRIINIEPLLSDYDAVCGDGDCGVVLKKGAVQVLNTFLPTIAVNTQAQDAASFCSAVASAISASMGGTSGALLEICFRAMAASFVSSSSSVADNARQATSSEWIQALLSGVEAICFYGGADVGMRTMLDALVPAVQALKETSSLAAAANAAREGAEATKTMLSLAGRSNYVAADKMQGIPDPGAFAVAEAMDAALGCFQ